jgi:hypothetical protein
VSWLDGGSRVYTLTKAQPTGNYAIILGDKTQTNPVFLRNGMAKVLDPLVASNICVAPRLMPQVLHLRHLSPPPTQADWLHHEPRLS